MVEGDVKKTLVTINQAVEVSHITGSQNAKYMNIFNITAYQTDLIFDFLSSVLQIRLAHIVVLNLSAMSFTMR